MQRVRELWRLIKSGKHVVSLRNLGLGTSMVLLAPVQAGAAVCEVNDVDLCFDAGPYGGANGIEMTSGTVISGELPSTGTVNATERGVWIDNLTDATLYNLGSIQSDIDGFRVDNGSSLTLHNDGEIAATSGSGILSTGGQVNVFNNAGATISGTVAVFGSSLNDTVYNAGTLSGTINSGNLGIGNDSLTLDTGSVLNGGSFWGGTGTDALILNGSGTEDNAFADFETLEMNGGQWTLSNGLFLWGSSTTNIINGTLLIDGSLVSDTINVGAGGALGGNGLVEGDIDVLGQMTSSFGNLSVDGDVTFHPGSSLAVTLGANSSSTLTVTGNAVILGGTSLVVDAGDDIFVDTTATVLTAGGLVSGAFDTVVDENGQQLFFKVESGANDVEILKVATVGVGQVLQQAATGVMLDAHRGLLNTIHARIDHRYRDSAGKTGVQRVRGEMSSAALMNAELDSQYGNLWHSDLDVTMQSDQHTPGFINDLMYSERSSDEKMRRTLSALPRLQITSNYGGMWLEGFGTKSKQSANGSGAGYTAESGGASLGLDSKAAKNWTFGGMIGYGLSNADLAGNAGSADGDTVYGGIYMANISTTHYANLFVTAGITKFEGERAVSDGVTDGVATDEFGAYMWDTRLELGRTFGFSSNSYVRPNVAVEYISAYQDDYSDDGAGLVPGLTVDEHTTRQFRTEGQVDVLFGSDEVNDSGWSGRIYTGIAHEIYLDDMMTEAFLSGFATPIAMSTGDKDHRTFSMYGVSLSWAMNQRLRAHLSYQGEKSSDLRRDNLVAGISVSW